MNAAQNAKLWALRDATGHGVSYRNGAPFQTVVKCATCRWTTTITHRNAMARAAKATAAERKHLEEITGQAQRRRETGT